MDLPLEHELAPGPADARGAGSMSSAGVSPFSCVLYLDEFGGQQPLGGLSVEPERGQRLGTPAAGEHDAEQHMLGADVVVAEPQSRLQGALERGPAVRAEAQLVQDRRIRVRAWRGGLGADRDRPAAARAGWEDTLYMWIASYILV